MRMDITRRDFLSLLERCSPAARDGALMTMARMVRLEGSVTGLKCYAVGTTISVESQADAVQLEPGRCSVDSVRAIAAVAAMPEGLVHLKCSDEALVVSAGRRRFTLPLFAIDDFPDIPKSPTGDVFNVPAEAVALCIERTQWARDTGRDFLNGVLLTLEPGKITGVALNGHAWALTTVPIHNLHGSASFFFPERTLKSILALCPGEQNKLLELASDGRRVFISDQRTLVSALLPVQKFLDYNQVLDQIERSTVDLIGVDGKELCEAFKACVVADAESKGSRGILLDISEHGFSVSLERAEGSEIDGAIELDAEILHKDAIRVAADGGYLVHCAQHCDRALIGGDPTQHLRIRSADGTYQAIVAPMNTSR